MKVNKQWLVCFSLKVQKAILDKDSWLLSLIPMSSNTEPSGQKVKPAISLKHHSWTTWEWDSKINYLANRTFKRLHKFSFCLLCTNTVLHTTTHTAPLICTLSTKPSDYCFLRSPPQALTLQLISNAKQKWMWENVLSWLASALSSNNPCVASEPPRMPIVSSPLCRSCGKPRCQSSHVVGQQTPLGNNNNTNSRGVKKTSEPIRETRDAFASSANPTGTPSLHVSASLCHLLSGKSIHASVSNTKGRHSQRTQHSPTSHPVQLNAEWEMGK